MENTLFIKCTNKVQEQVYKDHKKYTAVQISLFVQPTQH